jgi:hypothetical protein
VSPHACPTVQILQHPLCVGCACSNPCDRRNAWPTSGTGYFSRAGVSELAEPILETVGPSVKMIAAISANIERIIHLPPLDLAFARRPKLSELVVP